MHFTVDCEQSLLCFKFLGTNAKRASAIGYSRYSRNSLLRRSQQAYRGRSFPEQNRDCAQSYFTVTLAGLNNIIRYIKTFVPLNRGSTVMGYCVLIVSCGD